MEDLSSLLGRSYKTGKLLGSGTFGDVYTGFLTASDQEDDEENRIFAIKCFDDQRCFYGIHYTAIREIKYLREFDAQHHPNIIKLHDVYMDGKMVNLVLDYCLFDLAHIISDGNSNALHSSKTVSKDPPAVSSARAEGKWDAFRLQSPDGEWVPLTASQLFDFQSPKPQLFRSNVVGGSETGSFIEDVMGWEYIADAPGGRPVGVDLQWSALPLGDIKRLSTDILRAVDFVHSHSVVHQDIKPGNFFLNGEGILKLGDFGLARDLDSHIKRKVRAKGTTWYRPPELLFGSEEMTLGVDLWAVGCIIAELFLRTPFLAGSSELGQITAITRTFGFPTTEQWPGKNDTEACRLMVAVSPPPLERFLPAACPPCARDLIKRLMLFDPMKRLPCAKVLKHRFFTLAPLPSARKDLQALNPKPAVTTPEPPAVTLARTTNTGTKRKLGRITPGTRTTSPQCTCSRRGMREVVTQTLFCHSSECALHSGQRLDPVTASRPSTSKRKRSVSNPRNLTSIVCSFSRAPPSSTASMARSLFGNK